MKIVQILIKVNSEILVQLKNIESPGSVVLSRFFSISF